MLFEILRLLLQTFFGLFVLILLARFWMQVFRTSFRNPVGGMVLALSDWMVLPARRVVPALAGLDLASFLCAWVVKIVELYLVLWLKESLLPGNTIGSGLELGVLTIVALSLVELARSSVYLLFGVVLLQVLISWINPYSSIGPTLAPVVRPFYRPFRRLMPAVRGFDLSPVFLLVSLQIVLIVLEYVHHYVEFGF
jgi:YggT family protein